MCAWRMCPTRQILNSRDAIIKITTTAICGSDLHLYNGYIPTMEAGDILGHEFMGEVVEAGKDVTNLQKGDRVVMPFTIACGNCFFCESDLWSCCDNSNPNAGSRRNALRFFRFGTVRLFAHARRLRGRSSRIRARPVCRCRTAENSDGLTDEQVLFLSDIFPTGYHGGGKLQHSGRRHGRRLGRGSGRAIRRQHRRFCSARKKSLSIDHYKDRLEACSVAKAKISKRLISTTKTFTKN